MKMMCNGGSWRGFHTDACMRQNCINPTGVISIYFNKLHMKKKITVTHSEPELVSDITRETDKGADEFVGGRSLADEPRDNAENCAKACAQNPECDTFSFDPFKVEGSRCEGYSGGVLEPIFTGGAAERSQQGQISAWCPKGSWEKIILYFSSLSNIRSFVRRFFNSCS